MTRASKKLAVAVAIGGLAMTGGIAAALELPTQPDPSVAEEKVAEVEARTDNANEHADNDDAEEVKDEATDAEASDHDASGEGERPTDTHGYEVSQLATTTESEGREKGEEISTLARTNGAATSDEHADNDDASAGADKSAEARRAHGR